MLIPNWLSRLTTRRDSRSRMNGRSPHTELVAQPSLARSPDILEDRTLLSTFLADEGHLADPAVQSTIGIETILPQKEANTPPSSLSSHPSTLPDLPGLTLVDPNTDVSGQIIFLDFDGAEDVIYNGPVTVGPFDVPAFEAPGELVGQEEAIIASVVEQLEQTFAGSGVIFTTEQPVEGVEYSTIYVGGDDSAFDEDSALLGLAEQVDIANVDRHESGFVFSLRVFGSSRSNGLTEVTAHEIGHILGYAHDAHGTAMGHSDLASVAYEVRTHEYIAEEASGLYRALFGVSGITLEHQDYLSLSETSSSDSGNSIIEGVDEEDDGSRFFRHFSAGGDGNELIDGLAGFDSAYTRAIDRYSEATSNFHAGNTSTAYWWLGRTIHLAQDATLPAHVHKDQHGVGDDEYEDTAHSNRSFFTFSTFANGTSWNFQEWAAGYEDWSNSEALWDRSDDYGSLEEIFRETTDYTDDYDSDDAPGDWHNSISGDFFSPSRLSQLDRSHHDNWANDSVNGGGFDDTELTAAEVRLLARDQGTWAVEQSAMLLRYFYADLGEVVSQPSNLTIDGTSANSIQLDWSPVSGIDGYVVFRSETDNSGFARVGSPSVSAFNDTGRSSETTYYYRVFAYNDVAGLGSGYSSISATTDPSPDTSPPTPNPSSFSTNPAATGTSTISMTATAGSDPSGVEYYFDETSGNSGGSDSGWQASRTYVDSGLSANTTYTYRVRTRDMSAGQNTGSYSTSRSATTQQVADTSPPTPNPSSFSTNPAATGTSTISMTATAGSDPSGVEYYFDETSGNSGGSDSGWQASRTYVDSGLSANTTYTYRVRTRDMSAGQNTGSYSTSRSATTQQVADTSPPTPNPSSFSTNPAATGTSTISMTATAGSDPSGVEYYFDETSGNSGGSDSGWQASRTYVDSGLSANTTYTYRVRTRDMSAGQNTGSYSTARSAATDAMPLLLFVDTTSDTADQNPGDGIAEDAAGNTSLRSAIMEANALGGDQTIIVPAGTYALTRTGNDENAASSGDLDITDTSGSTTITGSGLDVTVIDASQIDRVLDVLAGGTLVLNSVIVTGGDIAVSDEGGGGLVGKGGGIRNAGTLTVTNSVISDNFAEGGGGGISNRLGTLTITDSSVSENRANSDGGGIENNSGDLTVTGSTISGNSSDAPVVFGHAGGGIFNTSPSNSPNTVTITNTTISGNSADNGGGGIRSDRGNVTIRSSTIVNNTDRKTGGGGLYNQSSTVNVANSIIAGNTVGGVTNDVRGSIASQTNNLIGGDPRLGPLQDNGGPTRTHALLAGSPAIDSGDNTAISAAADQRGFTRLHDADGDGTVTVDIGAFEFSSNEVVYSFDSRLGRLSVFADESASIRIHLDQGQLVIANSDGQVESGGVTGIAAGKLRELAVTGGDGGNEINLSSISSARFPNLSSVKSNAGSGPDTLHGSAIAETLNGGSGDDVIYGGAGSDIVYGGAGRDLIFGDGGDDRLFGNAGYDTIAGGPGADFVRGGVGADRLSGNDGQDQIIGDQHNDTLSGGDGADTLDAGDGADTVFAGAGFDVVDGGTGNDRLFGNENNDTILGGSGDDFVRGGQGADRLSGDQGQNEIVGDQDNDTLIGGNFSDTLSGGDGDDRIFAAGGFDLVDGGNGNDALYGQDGNDTLRGGNGRDFLRGGTGHDVLNGDGGFDTLFGDKGDDTITAGDGNDTVFGGNGRDSVSGGAGNDRLFGNNGYDTISGGIGNDFIRGGRGRDSLNGDAGNDELIGDEHNDTLIGGSGSDRATGGAGADTIDVQEAPLSDGIDSVIGSEMADTIFVDPADLLI